MNISIATRKCGSLVVLLVSCGLAFAQAPQSDCITAPSKDCDLHTTITDVAAPDAPAITVLGLSPTNISKPTSPAEFATDLLNAFDDNGHFQSGVALDAVPFLVFGGRSFTLGDYAASGVKAYVIRVLARTSTSFATVKGTSSPDMSVRLATGFRVTLLDLSDPRAKFYNCVAKINPKVDPNNPTAASDLENQIKKCRSGDTVWNGTSLVIAGAPTWISNEGSTTSLKQNGGGYWISYAQGLGTWGQLIINGRRQTGEHVAPQGASTTTTFVLQDTTVAGGAFRIGHSDFNGVVEGLYIGKRTGGIPDSYPEFGFGIEKKLADNLYLDANYRYDVNSKLSTSGVLANLKWSFSQQPKRK